MTFVSPHNFMFKSLQLQLKLRVLNDSFATIMQKKFSHKMLVNLTPAVNFTNIFLKIFLCQKLINQYFKYKKSADVTFIRKSCSLNVSEFKTWTIPISVGRSSWICKKLLFMNFLGKSCKVKLKSTKTGRLL